MKRKLYQEFVGIHTEIPGRDRPEAAPDQGGSQRCIAEAVDVARRIEVACYGVGAELLDGGPEAIKAGNLGDKHPLAPREPLVRRLQVPARLRRVLKQTPEGDHITLFRSVNFGKEILAAEVDAERVPSEPSRPGRWMW